MRQLFPKAGGPGDEAALRRLVVVCRCGRSRTPAARWRWVNAGLRQTPGPWQSQASDRLRRGRGARSVGRRSERDGRRCRSSARLRSTRSGSAIWRGATARPSSRRFSTRGWARCSPRRSPATPLPKGDDAELAWARWLADRERARGLGARSCRAPRVDSGAGGGLLEAAPSWDRFWVLGARRWEPAPLVALLPDDARAAWFRFWETAAPPRCRTHARGAAVEARVSLAVGRLVSGTPARPPIR